MHRFFMPEAGAAGETVRLSEEDARHALRVLRMQPGDPCELLGGGKRWLCAVDSVEDGVILRLEAPLPGTEPQLRVTLFQGLPKADKMELITQKAVELGAAALVPVAMSRSVVKLDAKDAARKTERWQRIAREACKQSGRCEEPTVSGPVPFSALPGLLSAFDAALVPWEEEHSLSLPAFRAAHPVVRRLALLIGPEGGIEPGEIDVLRRAGACPVTLGPRILRTETAGLAALAALMCLYGEMG